MFKEDGMKKGTIPALLMGMSLSVLPCLCAVESQTDWLNVPEVYACDYKWEKIDTEGLPAPWDAETMSAWLEDHGTIPGRTHDEDVIKTWWELAYGNDPDIPDDIEEAAYIYGGMFNICPELLMAICDKETGGTYRCDLADKSGTCVGPMQINLVAQRERIADYGLISDDMYTADGAMIVAASYIAELFETYEDPAVVLMKYNGAVTDLKEYRKSGKINYYTDYVLALAAELEEKHKRG